MFKKNNKLPLIVYLPIVDNGRSLRVQVLVGLALLKGDFFSCELDVLGVTDLLVLLLVMGNFFESIFFCYKKEKLIYVIILTLIILQLDNQ